MTDDDIERRLRDMLDGRAHHIDARHIDAQPGLEGPALRARSARRVRTTRRTVGQSIVAAAAVLVIAVGTQLIPREQHRPGPVRERPGGNPSTSQRATPSPASPTPTTSPSTTPPRARTGRPTLAPPSRSASPTSEPSAPRTPARSATDAPSPSTPVRSTAVSGRPPTSRSRQSATAARVSSPSDSSTPRR